MIPQANRVQAAPYLKEQMEALDEEDDDFDEDEDEEMT